MPIHLYDVDEASEIEDRSSVLIIPLLLLNRDYGFDTEELKSLVELFLAVRGVRLDVVLIFVGVGGTLFPIFFSNQNASPGNRPLGGC